MFTSTLILALGALLTGAAPSLAGFLAGRAVSGVGAAGIFSVATILVVDLTPPKQRGLWTGALNTGFTVGVAAGAVLAGALEPLLGWRALFYLQMPFAVLGGACLVLSIPASLSVSSSPTDDRPRDQPPRPLLSRLAAVDYVGALLLVLSILTLLYGLSPPTLRPLSLLASALLFPLFLLRELRHHPDPIIPVSVLASRGVLLSCLATLGFMMSRWAVLFYTPVLATTLLAWSPAPAGALLIPTNIGFGLGGLAAGALHIRRAGGWYTACLVVTALFAASLALLAFATGPPPAFTKAHGYASLAGAEDEQWPAQPAGAAFLVALVANGAAAGAALNYALHHALHLCPARARFVAAALLAAFRGFAGTFGSALGGALFARRLRAGLAAGFARRGLTPADGLVRRLVGSPRAVRALAGAERAAAVEAYAGALRGLFAAAAGLAVLVFFVQAGTGWTAPEEGPVEGEGGDAAEDDDVEE
jgi:predicted MFS family arabinose efflux permease